MINVIIEDKYPDIGEQYVFYMEGDAIPFFSRNYNNTVENLSLNRIRKKVILVL